MPSLSPRKRYVCRLGGRDGGKEEKQGKTNKTKRANVRNMKTRRRLEREEERS